MNNIDEDQLQKFKTDYYANVIASRESFLLYLEDRYFHSLINENENFHIPKGTLEEIKRSYYVSSIKNRESLLLMIEDQYFKKLMEETKQY